MAPDTTMPASVSFSTWHADVADLVRRPVAVDRRMDDGVVDEGHALLAVLVPAPRVVLVRLVELGIGAERAEERRLVVGRAAHPAIGELRPLGDGVAPRDHLVERLRGLEERVRHATVAGFGRQQDFVLALGVVQRVVQPRHHPRGVAEGLVLGHVLDPLAVDEDLAPVGERGEVVGAGLRRGDLHLAGGLRPRREGFAVVHASRAFGGFGEVWPFWKIWQFWNWRLLPSVPSPGAFVRLSNDCTMCERD